MINDGSLLRINKYLFIDHLIFLGGLKFWRRWFFGCWEILKNSPLKKFLKTAVWEDWGRNSLIALLLPVQASVAIDVPWNYMHTQCFQNKQGCLDFSKNWTWALAVPPSCPEMAHPKSNETCVISQYHWCLGGYGVD